MNSRTVGTASGKLGSHLRRRLLLILLWSLLALVFVGRFRDEVMSALGLLPDLHLAVLAALGLFAVWTCAAAVGWLALLRAAVPAGVPLPPLRRLVLIRVQAQALNFVLPTAGLAGEGLRALSAAQCPEAVRGSVVATVLDNLATAVAGLTIAAAAVPLLAVAYREPWQVGLVGSVALVVLGVTVENVPFVLAPRLLRLFRPSGKIAGLLDVVANRPDLHPAHRRAVAWHLLERVVSVGEVHAVMIALGTGASLADSTAVTAVFVLVSFAAFFVPAQLGVAEVAVVMACIALGFPAEVGIAVALVRRTRQLTVCALGLILLLRARVVRGIRPAWPRREQASEQGGCP